MNRVMRCVALTLSSLSFCFAAVRAGRELVTEQRAPFDRDSVAVEPTSPVEPRSLSVPDRITNGLDTDPDRWLDSLAWFLTGGLGTDSHKVRAIHDWVTLNVQYDSASIFGDSAGGQRVAEILRTGRSACGGYANLFGELCRRSGLNCVTIHGRARGAGFRVLGPETSDRLEHAWNAVMVDGSWRLVDATWDASWFREGCGFEQHYSTDYLFPDPEWFIYTHLPAEPRWQLLEEPVSAAEFERLPYLTAEFFRLGLRLTGRLQLVNEAAAGLNFGLVVPGAVSVFCLLLAPDGSKAGPPIHGVRTRSGFTFRAALPSTGDWVAAIFARPGGPNGTFTGVAFFGFRTTALPDR